MGIMLVFPILGFYSTHCRDFKKREYLVDIGRNNVSTDTDLNLEIMDKNGQRQDYRNHNSYSNKIYDGDYGKSRGVYDGYNQDYNRYNSGY